MKLKSRRGFTLIEMLIAVAILAILIPVLFKTRAEWNVLQRDQQWAQQAIWALESQEAVVRSLPPGQLKETENAYFSREVMETIDLPEEAGSMTIADAGSHLRKISLALNWTGADGRRKSRLLTFYRYGI
jgi:prepilin-type N-terminal cleavage/methylation domain-containing protein